VHQSVHTANGSAKVTAASASPKGFVRVPRRGPAWRRTTDGIAGEERSEDVAQLDIAQLLERAIDFEEAPAIVDAAE